MGRAGDRRAGVHGPGLDASLPARRGGRLRRRCPARCHRGSGARPRRAARPAGSGARLDRAAGTTGSGGRHHPGGCPGAGRHRRGRRRRRSRRGSPRRSLRARGRHRQPEGRPRGLLWAQRGHHAAPGRPGRRGQPLYDGLQHRSLDHAVRGLDVHRPSSHLPGDRRPGHRPGSRPAHPGGADAPGRVPDRRRGLPLPAGGRSGLRSGLRALRRGGGRGGRHDVTRSHGARAALPAPPRGRTVPAVRALLRSPLRLRGARGTRVRDRVRGAAAQRAADLRPAGAGAHPHCGGSGVPDRALRLRDPSQRRAAGPPPGRPRRRRTPGRDPRGGDLGPRGSLPGARRSLDRPFPHGLRRADPRSAGGPLARTGPRRGDRHPREPGQPARHRGPGERARRFAPAPPRDPLLARAGPGPTAAVRGDPQGGVPRRGGPLALEADRGRERG